MDQLTLYVIAGPNGIGKTTATYDLLPKNIPIINPDEIARQVKLANLTPDANTQKYSNRLAAKLIKEQIDNAISFGIETTLCDVKTWKFLIEMKRLGYNLHLIFLCTDNIQILKKRIEERTMRGEQVESIEMEERYKTGLKLLDYYFDIPVRIQLIDNSENTWLVLQKEADLMDILSDPLPDWVIKYLGKHLNLRQDEEQSPNQLPAGEEPGKIYEKSLKKKVTKRMY